MNRSVCFTGHRTIAEDKETLSARLYALLERLVTEQKITDFYTGGAVACHKLLQGFFENIRADLLRLDRQVYRFLCAVFVVISHQVSAPSGFGTS